MSKQEIKIVLGLMFGDEGKGNTVQWLCHQALEEGKSVAVIRFSGGPQAAHRVKIYQKEHICSSYGSGCLLKVPTYWTSYNTFIDPISIMQERKVLLEKDIDLYPQLINSYRMRFITPYDILANQSDKKTLEDGTCGKGIYSTYKRYKFSTGGDTPEHMLADASDYWGIERDEYLDRLFKQSYYQLLSRQDNIPLRNYDVLIYEGSQGVLLDAESEFFPNVTPSKTDLTFLQELLGENTEIYLCSRLYLTRHGNGYIPKGNCVETFFKLKDVCNPPNKFQGTMKYGLFDLSLYTKSLERLVFKNAKPNLVFTHCDTLLYKMPYLIDDILSVVDFSKFINTIRDKFKYPIIGSFSDCSNLFIKL